MDEKPTSFSGIDDEKNGEIVVKIEGLNRLSQEKERINPEESLAWALEAKQLAVQIGYTKGLIRSLVQIGRSQWLRGNLNQALHTLLQALELVKKTDEHVLEVDILNALGNVNIYMHNYAHTLDYYGQALKLADAIGYDQMAAGILNNFGEVYKNLKDYSTALMYYHESLSRYEQSDWESENTIAMVNIGVVYCEMGEFEKAMEYADKSMVVHKNARYIVGEGYSRHLYGRIAHRQNLLQEAIREYSECLEMLPETADVNLRIDLCIDLYEALMGLGKIERALDHLMAGLEIAEELETDAVVAKFYSMIATHYGKSGNVEKETLYYKKYHDIYNQMTEIEQQNQLRSIAFQMEADEYLEKHRAYEVLTEQLKAQTIMLEEKTHALAQSKERMQVISEIGQQITATLNLSSVFQQIYEHTNSLMRADVLGIGVHRSIDDVLEYPYFIEYGKKSASFSISLTSETSWAVWCFKNKKEVFVNDVEKEFHAYIKQNQNSSGELMHSLLFCPLIVNDIPIGVITVQSREKHTYESHHLDTLRILASYAAIAINNARQSEELEKLNDQLKTLSEVDGLTSVANRRKFDAFVVEEWDRSLRDSNALSLLLIDIDYFKEYNDHYGHQKGDQVLQEVASVLRKNLKRSTDFIGRYGGDEFVVMLRNTDRAGALMLANQMVKAVAERQMEHHYGKRVPYVTVTIGVSTIFPAPAMATDILLQQADKALYMAKDKGRNGAVHFKNE